MGHRRPGGSLPEAVPHQDGPAGSFGKPAGAVRGLARLAAQVTRGETHVRQCIQIARGSAPRCDARDAPRTRARGEGPRRRRRPRRVGVRRVRGRRPRRCPNSVSTWRLPSARLATSFGSRETSPTSTDVLHAGLIKLFRHSTPIMTRECRDYMAIGGPSCGAGRTSSPAPRARDRRGAPQRGTTLPRWRPRPPSPTPAPTPAPAPASPHVAERQRRPPFTSPKRRRRRKGSAHGAPAPAAPARLPRSAAAPTEAAAAAGGGPRVGHARRRDQGRPARHGSR